MTDPHPSPEASAAAGATGAGSGPAPGRAPGRAPTAVYPGTPRWVKLLGICALVLVLVFAIIMVAAGGQHGPGRHGPTGDAGGHTAPMAQGVQRP